VCACTDHLMIEHTPTTYDDAPAAQELLEDSRQRQASALAPRERLVEFTIGGTFVLIALVLLLVADSGRPFDWTDAAVAVVALAFASRVTFEVGSTYTVPLQLVLVPMLFVLPPETVPPCVAAGLALGKLPEALVGRRPPTRLLMALGDSWFALGPAIVFAIAQPGAPDGHDWDVYLIALAAQFGFDFAASSLREALNGGPSVGEQLRECRWVYCVDLALVAPGLAVAFAAVERPWTVLLVLPLVALMAVFARERRARVDYVIELGRAYRGTALVLGNVVEADDAYTGRHSEGVVDLAVEVAEEMKLHPAARRNIEFSALLHDVGKIAVPKEIINKPGPLDEDEWAIMRRHTIEGQRLLDQIGGFMKDVGVIVRASHERFDGGGYPDGLAGTDIPLEARVVAGCDAFSAMTTDRAYRKGRPARAALAELQACSGTQFDPAVVRAVIAVVERRLAAEPPAPDELTLDPASVHRAPLAVQ
jgi:HD-GYP domain-containing protein (c-di-GMP phosphodiesterase class II)